MEFLFGLIGLLLVGGIHAKSQAGPICNCDYTFNPVCASDGLTYSNPCVLKCSSDNNVRNKLPALKIISKGACPKESCICPAIAKPVCGTDGRTYPNECGLGCDNKRRIRHNLPLISVAYEGKCTTPPNCADVIVPVCGTNDRTYRNICYLQYDSALEIAKGNPGIYWKNYGACAKESCICPLNIDPVCGSDGKTYNNECQLNCESRRRWALGQGEIKVVNKGECWYCDCPYPYDPWCASDDKTYNNYCLFECENKRRASLKLSLIKILYRGQCSPCVCNCSNVKQLVCATDGRTYYNDCWRKCTSNCYIYQGYPGVYFVKYGPC